jgi:hypothetical protein
MEACAQCGYACDALDRAGIAPELRARAERYGEVLRRSDADRLRARRRPEVWSALEYACHVRDLHRIQGARVLQACHEDEPDFAPMRREERVLEEHYNDQDPAHVATEITAAAGTMAGILESLDATGWNRTGIYHWPTTEIRTVEWIGRHTVHESVHHFRDIEELLEGGRRR